MRPALPIAAARSHRFVALDRARQAHAAPGACEASGAPGRQAVAVRCRELARCVKTVRLGPATCRNQVGRRGRSHPFALA
jgi:hypothetical protein